MKRNDLLSFLIDTALACLMTIASAGCLTTAFGLQVDMQTVALTALLFTALGCLCSRLKGGWLLAVLTAVGGILLLKKLDFASNFYSLLNQILTIYDMGYGWGVPEAILAYNDRDLTLSIQVISAFCGLFAGVYLSRSFHALSVLALLLPVLPCIVVTDTVPGTEYLLLAIATVAVLALTSQARHTDTRQANRLTALVLIPVILAGLLLFNRFPKSEYQAPDISQGMFDLMEQLAERIPFLDPPELPVTYPNSSATIHLDNAGPPKNGYTTLLEVVASQSGALYLRGRSYIGYTGLNWEAWPEQETMLPPENKYLIDGTQTIQIQALLAPGVTFFPYYPTDGMLLVDGAPAGTVQQTYLYRYKPLRGDWKRLWSKQYAALGVDNSTYASMQAYTQLPEDTYAAAQQFLQAAGVEADMSITQITERIRSFVEHSAAYDLSTQRMPQGETDFALWFLEHGETGYCVHFATAATVLLRAAGIPARYVVGYLVDATAGQTTPVRDRNSHAWTEYYVPNLGWVILEATPGEGLPVQLPTQPPETGTTRPTEPTKPTFPNGTTGPTAPTEPTEPTIPTQPTEPTAPTGPTEPTAPTEPAETTLPVSTEPTPGPGPSKFDWSGVLTGLQWLGKLALLVAVAMGQWRLRLALRRKWLAGKDFKHIRRRWRYACRLARLCGHGEPKPLLDLLKKAKFSRSGLSRREIGQFDRYCDACIRGLRKKPWPVRLVLRLLIAAW